MVFVLKNAKMYVEMCKNFDIQNMFQGFLAVNITVYVQKKIIIGVDYVIFIIVLILVDEVLEVFRNGKDVIVIVILY